MTLSADRFLRYLFQKKDTYKDGDKINRSIFNSTMNKMRFIAVSAALFGLAATLASFSKNHSSSPQIC